MLVHSSKISKIIHACASYLRKEIDSSIKKEKGATEVGNPKTEISAPQVFDTHFFIFSVLMNEKNFEIFFRGKKTRRNSVRALSVQ